MTSLPPPEVASASAANSARAARLGDLASYSYDVVGYPQRLRDMRCPPLHLDVRGHLGDHPMRVAIVGSRAASTTGMVMARSLAAELASRGASIVSGGAYGIDAAAHRGALDAGGHTIAVFGTGIDVVYPEQHHALFEQIVAAGGALVSMFARGAQPLPGHFVRRNDVIAAFADIVVVIEASARSGSLYTARAAKMMKRRVAAVAGSAGCDRLLADGTPLIECADDIIAVLAGAGRQQTVAAIESRAAAVAAVIERDVALDVGSIAQRSHLAVREVMCALVELEVAGWIESLPGERYRRTALSPSSQP